jgi:hypothetical protein
MPERLEEEGENATQRREELEADTTVRAHQGVGAAAGKE